MLARVNPLLVAFGFATATFSANLELSAQTKSPSRTANPVPPSVHVAPKSELLRLPGTIPTNFSDAISQESTDTKNDGTQVQKAAFVQETEQPKVPSLLAGPGRIMPPSQAAEIAKQKMQDSSDPASIQKSQQTKSASMPLSMPVQVQSQPARQIPKPAPAAAPPTSSGLRVGSGDEFSRPTLTNQVSSSSAKSATPDKNTQLISTGNSSSTTLSKTSYDGSDNLTAKGKDGGILAMALPAIEIEAFGPQTIGIHKRSAYKVIVRNTTSLDADNLTISVGLPQWVKLENVNTTIGRRETGTDQRSSKIVWVIDRLSPGSSQTMTVDAIPTKAEHFDLQVEWAVKPRLGSSRVQVTEPRLDMNIAGPNEVMYGETANYQVTVRNPGTGTAENVMVMLPEALGGERASLGEIAPGQEKTFQVELLARAAGQLDLTTTATGTGELQTNSTRQITVRRPALDIAITGPELKYSGSITQFDVIITNTGDAIAREVSAALAMPSGVQYVEGIEGAEMIDNALRWTIGTLDVGDKRTYRVACQMNCEGQMMMDLGARGSSDIAARSQCTTMVETVADLVLMVEDPKGPLPTGQKVDYTIRVKNRGSRAASDLALVMQYSEGIEPATAGGLANKVVPGQVIFSPIEIIEPGQEVVVQVTAQALTAGTHRFRAQLTGNESEVHEVAEGTTKFYGDSIAPTKTASEDSSGSNEFKR